MINKVESTNKFVLSLFRIFFFEEEGIDVLGNDIIKEFVVFPIDLLN